MRLALNLLRSVSALSAGIKGMGHPPYPVLMVIMKRFKDQGMSYCFWKVLTAANCSSCCLSNVWITLQPICILCSLSLSCARSKLMSTRPRLPLPMRHRACASWDLRSDLAASLFDDLAQVCRPNVYRTLVGSGLELEWRK